MSEKDDKNVNTYGLNQTIFGVVGDCCVNRAGKDKDISETINQWKHPNVKTSMKHKFSIKYTIKHFAGCVTYSASGFRQKNSDSGWQDIAFSVMRKSENKVIGLIYDK